MRRVQNKENFFTHSVSHDLKSPDISLYVLTQRLCEKYASSLDEKGKECCDHILAFSDDDGRSMTNFAQHGRVLSMWGHMTSQRIILIGDRNPHVRSFLARELKAEGFRVRLAGNGEEVLKWVYHSKPLDLIILDPDLPDDIGREILPKLYDRIPVIPVVIHSWTSDYIKPRDEANGVAFVKKEGDSIEALKRTVHEMLCDTTR